jgi:hypothetical protein
VSWGELLRWELLAPLALTLPLWPVLGAILWWRWTGQGAADRLDGSGDDFGFGDGR